MKQIFRRIVAALAVCCLLLQAGCGQTADDRSGTETAEPVTLTLACWVSDLELQTMVQQYNEMQDAYRIEITSYFTRGGNVQAALNRMKTKLLTGEVPDLFYLDSMDIMALVNGGMLADLNPLMAEDPDFQKADYFSNIWALLELDGALYELAPCFQVGCLMGPQSLLGDRIGWTVADCEAFMDTLDTPLLRTNRTDLMTYLVQFSMQNYLNLPGNTCNFLDGSFSELLDFAKSFSDNNASNYLLYDGWIINLQDFYYTREALGEPVVCVGYPSADAGGPCAMAISSFGISAATQYTDACWAFLKLLLTEENQEAIWSDIGLPVSRQLLEQQVTQLTLDGTNSDSMLVQWFGDGAKDMEPLTEAEATYFLNMIDDLQKSRLRYDDIMEIILEEAQSYFSTDQPVEQVAAAVQERVTLYLEEHA
jgi:multiple sugar transport system substrate-binding protein